MSVTKPAQNPLFDTNDTNTAEPSAKRADGYPLNSALPSNEHNWLHKAAGDWAEFAGRNTTWSTVGEFVEGGEGGDVAHICCDEAGYQSILVKSLGTGISDPSSPLMLATDGRYIAYEDDGGDVRLYDTVDSVDTLIKAGSSVTSLFMDGLYIWFTDGTDIYTYTYDGTQNATTTQAGEIYDVGLGYCVVKQSSTVLVVRDPDLVTIGTSGTLTSVSGARLCRVQSDGDPTIVVTHIISTVPNVSLYKLVFGTAVWDYPIEKVAYPETYAGMGNNLWLDDRGFAHWVYLDTTWYLHSVSIGQDAPSVYTYSVELAGVAAAAVLWQASPSVLIGKAIGTASALYVVDWRGSLPDRSAVGIDATWRGVCDGMDFYFFQWRSSGGGTLEIRKVPLGSMCETARRYSWNDWRPFCQSLVVGQGKT